MGNKVDHVVYVICGAGKHSKDGKPVIKYAAIEYLQKQKKSRQSYWGFIDFWANIDDGVFFVRLRTLLV